MADRVAGHLVPGSVQLVYQPVVGSVVRDVEGRRDGTAVRIRATSGREQPSVETLELGQDRVVERQQDHLRRLGQPDFGRTSQRGAETVRR